MTWIDATFLIPAFLAPMTPIRPRPPEPLPGNAWVATLIMVGLVVVMVAPMITIWSFHRPDESFRAKCEANGGHVIRVTLDGPPRCRPAQPSP